LYKLNLLFKGENMPNEQIPEDQEQEDKEIKRQRFF
jgi:hypothetical protein